MYFSSIACGRWVGHRRSGFSYLIAFLRMEARTCLVCCSASSDCRAHLWLWCAALHTVFIRIRFASGDCFSHMKLILLNLYVEAQGCLLHRCRKRKMVERVMVYIPMFRGYSETTATLVPLQNSSLFSTQVSLVRSSCCVGLRDCQVCREKGRDDVGRGATLSLSRQGPRVCRGLVHIQSPLVGVYPMGGKVQACELPSHYKCLRKKTQSDGLMGSNQLRLEQSTISAPFSHTVTSAPGIARYVIDIYEAEVPLKYMNQICEEPRRRAQVEVRSQCEGQTPLLLRLISISQAKRSSFYSG